MKLWDHTAPEIVAMPDDALGMLVLEDFGGGWNVGNYFNGVSQQHAGAWATPGLPERLADAWAWLEAQGLIGPHPTQGSSPNARRMTKAGAEALKTGLARVKAGRRLDVDLHPRLQWTVRRQFLMGEQELAAFAALREVEIRVRALSNFPDDLVGVSLMAAAFKPKTGPLAEPQAEGGEQEATMALFRGAIGTFKNPSSHRAVDYADPVLAAEVIFLADLLMRLLDRVEARL
ncbi:TIGR02391 family protein [Microlunatus antarcticus]|uniref:Uncharacterized protein (TIGR02391 family) n=1 Tax=Microlunatus antarcticus TaxID=53388 RepID=A0A7W5JUI5_9ACTN|nr:TIGR02391 family protein [Microlunatus antarcticus]MBB3326470.1 uncharacterized protein (TIGR02391 family) [Microlunatus antarcticus]